jgi:hypothetical protein
MDADQWPIHLRVVIYSAATIDLDEPREGSGDMPSALEDWVLQPDGARGRFVGDVQSSEARSETSGLNWGVRMK